MPLFWGAVALHRGGVGVGRWGVPWWLCVASWVAVWLFPPCTPFSLNLPFRRRPLSGSWRSVGGGVVRCPLRGSLGCSVALLKCGGWLARWLRVLRASLAFTWGVPSWLKTAGGGWLVLLWEKALSLFGRSVFPLGGGGWRWLCGLLSPSSSLPLLGCSVALHRGGVGRVFHAAKIRLSMIGGASCLRRSYQRLAVGARWLSLVALLGVLGGSPWPYLCLVGGVGCLPLPAVAVLS